MSQLTGPHANALLPGSPVEAQPEASTSGSTGSAQVRESEGQNGYSEVAVVRALSDSPALENGNSPVAQLPGAQQQSGGYASEPQHLAQIADLQASQLCLSLCVLPPCACLSATLIAGRRRPLKIDNCL